MLTLTGVYILSKYDPFQGRLFSSFFPLQTWTCPLCCMASFFKGQNKHTIPSEVRMWYKMWPLKFISNSLNNRAFEGFFKLGVRALFICRLLPETIQLSFMMMMMTHLTRFDILTRLVWDNMPVQLVTGGAKIRGNNICVHQSNMNVHRDEPYSNSCIVCWMTYLWPSATVSTSCMHANFLVKNSLWNNNNKDIQAINGAKQISFVEFPYL